MASRTPSGTWDGTDTSWRMRAACRGLDPELFFPLHARGSLARREMTAKRVCARCPVADHCLNWAVRHGEDFGIWGGTNERERRQLRASAVARRSGPDRRSRVLRVDPGRAAPHRSHHGDGTQTGR